MRVLGVDPGSNFTGWGVVGREGNRYLHVAHGTIRLGSSKSTKSKDNLPERLSNIFTELVKIISEYKPTLMTIENIFVAYNVNSALKLGQARGAVIVAGASKGLEVVEYSPTAIKLALVGYGHATKDQIQRMVKRLLNLPETPQADAADALAVSICHLQQSRLISSMKGLAKRYDRVSSRGFASKRYQPDNC